MAIDLPEYLPPAILEAIQSHIRTAGNGAHEHFEDNAADEDSLSGALSAVLRRHWTDGGKSAPGWRWKVACKKFTGRGGRSQEKVIGADAIFEVLVEDPEHVAITKGLLVQAKKGKNAKGLLDQITTMEEIAHGSSAVFTYSAHGYFGVDGRDYLERRAGLLAQSSNVVATPVGDYLADHFLACRVGLGGMSFQANSRRLIVPDTATGTKSIPAHFSERIRVLVESPRPLPLFRERR